MAPPPRVSERLGAGDPRSTTLLLALSAACALAACRQTVVLEPALTPDAAMNGAAGASGGNGPGGHMNGDAGEDGGGNNGAAGNHADGGHADGTFCPGGQLQPLNFTMRTPDVVFSVDRSMGMQTWFGTAGSRLQVIQDQIDALVAKYQKLVRFGYEEFPAASGMGLCNGGQGCCAGAVAPPTSSALRFIDNVRTPCLTTSGTAGMGGGSGGGPSSGCAAQTSRPTADALTRCDKTFMSLAPFPTPGNRYVVLLTGGDPSCMSADPTSTPCNDALNAVVRLNRDSISTAVFGVGAEAMGSQCLGQLADAGGLAAGGPSSYFLALTPTALSAAMSPVIETIAEQACQIDIRQPPADPTKVALLFDGVAVNQDGVDGWDFEPGSTLKITIHGAACDTLLQDAPHVDLVSGCSPPHH